MPEGSLDFWDLFIILRVLRLKAKAFESRPKKVEMTPNVMFCLVFKITANINLLLRGR
jgi:hypothetical protein